MRSFLLGLLPLCRMGIAIPALSEPHSQGCWDDAGTTEVGGRQEPLGGERQWFKYVFASRHAWVSILGPPHSPHGILANYLITLRADTSPTPASTELEHGVGEGQKQAGDPGVVPTSCTTGRCWMNLSRFQRNQPLAWTLRTPSGHIAGPGPGLGRTIGSRPTFPVSRRGGTGSPGTEPWPGPPPLFKAPRVGRNRSDGRVGTTCPPAFANNPPGTPPL